MPTTLAGMQLYSIGELADVFGASAADVEAVLERAGVPIVRIGEQRWVRDEGLRALFGNGPSDDESNGNGNGNGNGRHRNGSGNGSSHGSGRRRAQQAYPDSWPAPEDVREGILIVLGDHGGSGRLRQIYDELAGRFDIEDDELALRTADGADRLWHAYVRWCRIPLVHDKLVRSARRGTWQLVTAVTALVVVALQAVVLFAVL